MKRLLTLLLLASALLTAHVTYAADHATPDEAKAMAIKAANYLRSVGPDKAFPEFNASSGAWVDRDLYVIVSTRDHVVVADGGNPHLVGHSTANLKDVDGVSISEQVAAIKDAGWVKYKWQDPTTKMVEPKAVYWVIVDGYHVGVGAYAE
jgi:cytochrome c